jgi:hypothetical protein
VATTRFSVPVERDAAFSPHDTSGRGEARAQVTRRRTHLRAHALAHPQQPVDAPAVLAERFAGLNVERARVRQRDLEIIGHPRRPRGQHDNAGAEEYRLVVPGSVLITREVRFARKRTRSLRRLMSAKGYNRTWAVARQPRRTEQKGRRAAASPD